MTLKSIDEVQQYVDAETAAMAATVGAPQDLCATWKRARPVVLFIVTLLPSSWKSVVTPFTNALDTFCP